MKKPKVNSLGIEMTDKCNASCLYCHGKKNKGFIDIELFKSILYEFKEARWLFPHGWGEPTMHPEFTKMLSLARDSGKQIMFYTNASLFSPEMQKEIIDIGVAEIRFSIDGANKEIYEKIRGLNWETVLGNIEHFQKIKPNSIKTVARFCYLPEIHNQIEQIKEFWKQRVDRVHYRGEAPTKRSSGGDYVFKPCNQPLGRLTIAQDGSMGVCCMDTEYNIGKVTSGKEARILWESNYFDALRKQINSSTGESLDLCKACRSRYDGSEVIPE